VDPGYHLKSRSNIHLMDRSSLFHPAVADGSRKIFVSSPEATAGSGPKVGPLISRLGTPYADSRARPAPSGLFLELCRAFHGAIDDSGGRVASLANSGERRTQWFVLLFAGSRPLSNDIQRKIWKASGLTGIFARNWPPGRWAKCPTLKSGHGGSAHRCDTAAGRGEKAAHVGRRPPEILFGHHPGNRSTFLLGRMESAKDAGD